MTQSSTSQKALHRLRAWYLEDALPLWVSLGYDDARGGFFEALSFEAQPIASRPRRVRTQARQIHAFSQAGLRGWHDGAEALAAAGFDYFLSHGCPDEGARGCAHRLDENGVVIDDRRDLYDQAFLLLACASRWEAARDERALVLAEKTIAFMDAELASSHGAWLESDQAELPRRQNPHMHLFEAFLALHRVTGDGKYFSRVSHIYEVFTDAFFDADTGVIREFFDEEWRVVDKRQLVEPGHMLEWVWLLRAYERAGGARTDATRMKLYEQAIRIGADPGFFGFFDNRTPLSGAPHSAKRLWPQTEGLRASLVMDESAKAGALIDNLFMTYLAVETPGLWNDEFDEDGRPVSQDTPASILYHIHEAVAEADAVLRIGETA